MIDTTTIATLPGGRAATGTGNNWRPAALLVSTDGCDSATLRPIFRRQGWKLHTTGTLVSALDLLQERPIPVIISERDLPPYDWRRLFAHTRDLPHRPLLVVASTFADEYLWSEVLNLGGHDVLAKPFRESEVLHVLSHAWRRQGAAVVTASGSPHSLACRPGKNPKEHCDA